MQNIPDGFKLVPIWAVEMVSFEGFKRRWFYHYSTGLTQLEAYHRTENEFEECFNTSRYSNFESFRFAIHYHLKKKKLGKRLKKIQNQ